MTEIESRRSVVVTGASTGIGRATVADLVSEGFLVFATVRRLDDADGLREQFGDSVRPLLMDLLDEDSVRAAGAEVHGSGPLFGLVNNAGAALPGPLEYLPIDTFRRQLEINLTGQLLVTQVMLPALRRSAEQAGDARIVMVGSIGGRIAGPMLGAYHASKHGLVGLTGALRAELAPFGIRVLLIEPGTIATPIWERTISISSNAPRSAATRSSLKVPTPWRNGARAGARSPMWWPESSPKRSPRRIRHRAASSAETPKSLPGWCAYCPSGLSIASPGHGTDCAWAPPA